MGTLCGGIIFKICILLKANSCIRLEYVSTNTKISLFRFEGNSFA